MNSLVAIAIKVFFINGQQKNVLFYPVFGIRDASNTTLKPCAN
jgi:hypothetical protein